MSTSIQTQTEPNGKLSDASTAIAEAKHHFYHQRGFSDETYGDQIQAKLKIGQTGDVHEQEADRVAGQVMRMSTSECSDSAPVARATHLQCESSGSAKEVYRQEEEEEDELLQSKDASGARPELTADVQTQIQAIRGTGNPLSESERSFFEPRFGHSFSRVRIHTGSLAAETVRSLNAKAFTVGQDIVFGAGQFAPDSTAGQKLMAHELAHTIQQLGGDTRREDIHRQPLEEEDEKDTVQAKTLPGRAPPVTPSHQSGHPGLKGSGQPLSASLRSLFESRLDHDFRSVHMHTDSQAASMAQSANARAVTLGHDIAFAPRQFGPNTNAGRWLIGHELAHVVQQAAGKVAAPSGNETLEAEADQAADAAIAGKSFWPMHAAQPGCRQTVPVATGPGGVEVPSPDRIILTNFDIERSNLKPQWMGAIGLASTVLNLNPCKEAQIEGHTDSTGGETFNMNLSDNRASTIQQALESLVLEPAVASPITTGFGEGSPIDANATPSGRARNRRVEIRIVDRPLPNIDRVELLNSVASHTFVIPAAAPVPRSGHGVTVTREVTPDANVRAVLNPPLNPGDRRMELIAWTGAAQNPANPIEADISRARGQNVAVAQISCPTAATPASSAQFTVWSVDATITSATPSTQVVGAGPANQRLTMTGLNFNVLVTPVTLFSTIDAPDMSGSAPVPTPVPGAGTPHFLSGNDLGGGVDSRWDVSRRIRSRFVFPTGLTAAGLGASVPSMLNLPVPSFPANRLLGNDDSTTTDPEDNNPFADGRMSGFDLVRVHIRRNAGSHGDRFVGRIHFQEFVRLDLGGAWRQISGDHPWKLHYSIIKFNALGTNRWFNAGSFGALDNAGF